MSLQLSFDLQLDSDYHVSAGHGRGSLVDSVLQRDADGLPVLRGTTLVGLLRDALSQLLQEPVWKDRSYACCQSAGGPEKDAKGQEVPRFCRAHDPDKVCPVCRLFGSPARRKRWRINSARLSESPTPASRGWQPAQTGGQIAPHVRVNPRTRRAEARKLFFREEGDQRLRFRFTATCEAEDDAALQEAIWLVAAARYLRHLGAGRRRGRGACHLHLLDDKALEARLPARSNAESCETWFLRQFEQRFLTPLMQLTPLHLTTSSSEPFAPSQSPDKDPVRLLLLARLDEPVIMAERSEVGNELRSLDYIAGNVLRGALAGRVAGRHNLENKQGAALAAFARLFLHGQVQFTHLYPVQKVDGTLYPAIPAPHDLYTCEIYPGFGSGSYDVHGVEGLAHKDPQEAMTLECKDCHATRKNLSGYWSLNKEPEKVNPQRVHEMHPHIHPSTRRAASGALFGYEALAPGQYFLGELTCTHRAAWEDLASLADLPLQNGIALRLGRATGSGYGCTMLWIEERDSKDLALWCPLPLKERVKDLHTPLTLTLLTDAILCDRWGRFVTCPDAAWLQGLLDFQVRPLRAFCTSRVLDSFNAYLGLPRWRDVAVCAGSAVGIELTQNVDLPILLAKLERIEREGIGLRRNEGFGRVAFNHPLYQGCASIEPFYVQLAKRPGMGLSDTDKANPLYQETLFRQIWARELEGENAPRNWEALQHSEFASVARLMRHEQPASKDTLNTLMQGLGHAKRVLPATLVDAELGIREAGAKRVSFFEKEGKAGVKLLEDLAQALQETCEQQAGAVPFARWWQIGLEMLAERIAAEAQKEPT